MKQHPQATKILSRLSDSQRVVLGVLAKGQASPAFLAEKTDFTPHFLDAVVGDLVNEAMVVRRDLPQEPYQLSVHGCFVLGIDPYVMKDTFQDVPKRMPFQLPTFNLSPFE